MPEDKGRLVAQKQRPSRVGRFISSLTTPSVDLPDTPLPDFIEGALEGATSPLGLISAGLAPVARTGPMYSRVAKEVAVASAGNLAAEQAGELTKDLPGGVQIGAQLGAAVLGGGLTARGLGNKTLPSRIKVLEQEDLTRSINDFQDPVDKISYLIRNAKPAEKGIEAARHAERSKRVGVYRSRVDAAGGGIDAYLSQSGALAGELPNRKFQPLTDMFTKGELDQVFQRVKSAKLQTFEERNIAVALTNVWENGVMPRPFEIDLLKRVYGEDFVASIMKHQSKSEMWRQNFYAALNLPRAVKASMDMSAPLRQGILLAPRHRKEWAGAMRPMMKAWSSEQGYKEVMDTITENPRYAQMKASGLELTTAGAIDKQMVEEAFYFKFTGERLNSSLLGAGVNASERAYSAFLNKLRADTFTSIAKGWEGTTKTAKDYEDLAKFLNNATGRAKLPEDFARFGPTLNALFFAPRLLYSRFAVVADLFTATPAVRAEIAKDLGSFVGSGMTVLTLLKTSGMADVEADPRSSDFGKIKVGNTTYDFWAGYQQIARYTAQAITGEQKGRDGRIRSVERVDSGQGIIEKFFRSKMAPNPGLAYDLYFGKNFLGEEVRADDVGIAGQLASNFVPLFVSDVRNAIKEDGFIGGLKTIPSFFGAGTNTYVTERQVENLVAQEKFGKDYRDLGYSQQQQVKSDQRVLTIAAKTEDRLPSDYEKAVDEADLMKAETERILGADFRAGKNPKDVADGLAQARRDAFIKKRQAQQDFGVTFLPADSPLGIALDGYYALYEKADKGMLDGSGVRTGIVDWEVYDELETRYMASLTPEQRAYVEDRNPKKSTDPSIAFMDEAKDYIKKTGYYDKTGEAFTKNQRLAQRAMPGVTSFSELLQAANLARLNKDMATYKRLTTVINKIEADGRKEKEALRKKDALLDSSLFGLGRSEVMLHKANKAKMR
jgi:hypothetical protein